MRRINIYGGPGIGKSTVAAWLFARLKQQGRNVELVNEWIKSWAWQGIKPNGFDQLYIYAKQLRKEDIVLRHGGIIITDSPLRMQLSYINKITDDISLYTPLYHVTDDFEKLYPSYNIVLDRDPDRAYRQSGRYHTEAQAKEIDRIIHFSLETGSVDHVHFSPSELMAIEYHVVQMLNSSDKKGQ